MTKLVLIRHGESQCTVDGVVGGSKGCTGLSPGGVRQAERLRDRLLRTGELADTDVVMTSVLPRAIETAEVIAPGLGRAASVQAKQDCDLCELHPGEADGLRWDEFQERYGNVDMRADPHRPMAPGGESLAGFLARLERTLGRIMDEYVDQNIVLVVHGGVIWGSATTFMGLSLPPPVYLNADNTSLTEWRFDADRTELVRFNDAAHLTDACG